MKSLCSDSDGSRRKQSETTRFTRRGLFNSLNYLTDVLLSNSNKSILDNDGIGPVVAVHRQVLNVKQKVLPFVILKNYIQLRILYFRAV